MKRNSPINDFICFFYLSKISKLIYWAYELSFRYFIIFLRTFTTSYLWPKRINIFEKAGKFKLHFHNTSDFSELPSQISIYLSYQEVREFEWLVSFDSRSLYQYTSNCFWSWGSCCVHHGSIKSSSLFSVQNSLVSSRVQRAHRLSYPQIYQDHLFALGKLAKTKELCGD